MVKQSGRQQHAIRGELAELAGLIHAVGADRYRQAIGLCLTAGAYVAVDVSGRWPTDADVRQIARNTVRQETRLPLGEDDVYDYLSGAALGFRPLPEALDSGEAAATLPVLITGSMLFTFRPHGTDLWDYLDQIWRVYEKVEDLDASVLPVLQVHTHMLKAAEER
jgi:hypothetical protein